MGTEGWGQKDGVMGSGGRSWVGVTEGRGMALGWGQRANMGVMEGQRDRGMG